jgi:hypothetical protein
MRRGGTRTNEPVSPSDSSVMSIRRSHAFASGHSNSLQWPEMSAERLLHTFPYAVYFGLGRNRHRARGAAFEAKPKGVVRATPMTQTPSTSVRLITRCQAWFQAVESLQVIDPQWLQQVAWSTSYRMLVRAWLGRGPLEHLVGQSMILYFDNGEENYPTFQHPSAGPKGTALRGGLSSDGAAYPRSNTCTLLIFWPCALMSVDVTVIVCRRPTPR